MSPRSTQHATFVLERAYEASPARVFRAWSDPEMKARWFVGPEDWTSSEYELDFREGGRERVAGGPPGGPVHHYDARISEIVVDQRIVYTYEMKADDTRISVTLATVEFKPAGAGTRLILTEQSVFLDSGDTVAARKEGTRALLDSLDAELRRDASAV